jgi:DNA-binding FrmR family transcriptional regulator
MMDKQTGQTSDIDYAAEAATEATSVLTRYGWTGEMLFNFIRTNENHRVFNATITLNALTDGVTKENEKDRAPQVLGHLQRALAPQPSGRWSPLVARRTAQAKQVIASRLSEMFGALYRDAERRPAIWLKALIDQLNVELKGLDRQRSDAQAQLRQAEAELQPLQQRINQFLQANASRQTITRFVEFLATLFQNIDRGVGLTSVVLMAERLVNDRETYAFAVDTAGAASSVLQEIRGQVQAEREQFDQFMLRCRHVAQQLAAARSSALARLAAHPYADINLAQDGLIDRLSARVPTEATNQPLNQLLALDEAQLFQKWREEWLVHTRQHTQAISLLELMEMEAAEIEARQAQEEGHADLVVATLEAAYRRAATPALDLEKRVTPREWWLVGVPDETNSGFAFEDATLVGTGRRDQVQFVHVAVGLAPQDVMTYAATRDPFEQAALHRNFYVFEALAQDDHARQVFALGLAIGVIGTKGGVFVLNGRSGEALGANVEDALERFTQRPELIKDAEAAIDEVPVNEIIDRLEAYLARGRGVQEELWWEFASYVRDRLELLKHQAVFVRREA